MPWYGAWLEPWTSSAHIFAFANAEPTDRHFIWILLSEIPARSKHCWDDYKLKTTPFRRVRACLFNQHARFTKRITSVGNESHHAAFYRFRSKNAKNKRDTSRLAGWGTCLVPIARKVCIVQLFRRRVVNCLFLFTLPTPCKIALHDRGRCKLSYC